VYATVEPTFTDLRCNNHVITLYTPPLYSAYDSLPYPPLFYLLLLIDILIRHTPSIHTLNTLLFTQRQCSTQGITKIAPKSFQYKSRLPFFQHYTQSRYSALPIGLVTDRPRHIIGFLPHTTRHSDQSPDLSRSSLRTSSMTLVPPGAQLG
jgi:hypothetical protein